MNDPQADCPSMYKDLRDEGLTHAEAIASMRATLEVRHRKSRVRSADRKVAVAVSELGSTEDEPAAKKEYWAPVADEDRKVRSRKKQGS